LPNDLAFILSYIKELDFEIDPIAYLVNLSLIKILLI